MDRSEIVNRLHNIDDELSAILRHIVPAPFRCDACGHTRYEDFNRKQAADAITGAITRVRKASAFASEPQQAPRAPKEQQ